jgi:hypothetical protein
MGLFDGLIAKMSGAITSVESRAAGLFHLPTAAPVARAEVPFDFMGPPAPGRKRASTRPLAIPVSPSTFNKVEEAMRVGVKSGVGSMLDPFGLFNLADTLGPQISKPAAAKPDYSSDISTWGADLSRWDRILSSLDKTMNQRDGRADISARVGSWHGGPFQGAVNLLSALQSGSGDRASVEKAYTNAIAEAKDLEAATKSGWADFQASGVPTVGDYVKAPFTAVSETGVRVQAAAYKAAKAVEEAAAPALASTGMLLQYGPWILGGLAVLYASTFLPRARRD